MIIINNKHKCCGCSACVQVCPKHCIAFEEDEKGFMYPLVDNSVCIDCGLCESVCPVLKSCESRKPIKVYAAINSSEETRMRSSSGGIFTLLAKSIINEGGVVFGAKFNDQKEVVHGYSETIEGLEPLQGSKYVQSVIGDCFQKTKQFLIAGRKVLFTGTPCQIAGLKNFLGKEYDDLLTVDIVCHGVPSPLVWRCYKRYLLLDKGANNISSVCFRQKDKGWTNYHVSIIDDRGEVLKNETYRKNVYIQMFLKNLSLRPSCFDCPSKNGRSCSDLTIADYWGVKDFHPNLFDDKGTSIVCCYSLKGLKFFLKNHMKYEESFYDNIKKNNPMIEYSTSKPDQYDNFWTTILDKGFREAFSFINKPSLFRRLLNRICLYI